MTHGAAGGIAIITAVVPTAVQYGPFGYGAGARPLSLVLPSPVEVPPSDPDPLPPDPLPPVPLLPVPLLPTPLPPDPLDGPLPLVDVPLPPAVPDPAPVEAPAPELAPVELAPPELVPLLWLLPPGLLEQADTAAVTETKPIVSSARILFSLSTDAKPGQFADAFARVRLNCRAVR
jgi:hypothetical protein